jgi:hypothetical protein
LPSDIVPDCLTACFGHQLPSASRPSDHSTLHYLVFISFAFETIIESSLLTPFQSNMPRIASEASTTRTLPYTVVRAPSNKIVKEERFKSKTEKSAPYAYDKVLFLSLVLKVRATSQNTTGSMTSHSSCPPHEAYETASQPQLGCHRVSHEREDQEQ